MAILDDNTVDLFGKDVDDLMTNVSIEDGVATGTLKYVADYTSAGYDMSKGNHFVVFKATVGDGVVVETDIEGRKVTLDEDGIVILQMDEAKKSKSFKFTAAKPNGDKNTVSIQLSGLTLAEQQ